MYIITGQTATGKTSYAQELASKYNGEIINCDSRQIYKELNIITGKDIPHQSKYTLLDKKNNFDIGYYNLTLRNNDKTKVWLYDIVNPHTYFSSYDYVQNATYVINRVQKENKIPIFVGGTYFYIRHLLYGVDTEAIRPDFKLRKELTKYSLEKLQSKLKAIAPHIFEQLNNSDSHNPRRLIRKIEIEIGSHRHPAGVSKAGLDTHGVFAQENKITGFRFSSKDSLIKHIQERVEKRLRQGAIEEVQMLLELGYNEKDPGLKTIGYTSIIKYLKNEITKENAITEWITKEIQYAKRQLTFMKTDPHIEWKEIQ